MEKENRLLQNPDGNSRPVPDPTLLTTQQLLREMANLKEIIFTRLDGMDEAIHLSDATNEDKRADIVEKVELIRSVIETRLDGMDKAIRLLQDTADKFPSRIDEKISSLRNVHEERFSSIQVQFKERDTRSEQTQRDSKVAVDAALSAAKEAVAAQNISSAQSITKSENATAKQIDQLGTLISTTNKATDDKISDLKERLTRIEGRGEGKVDSRATSNYVIGIIGFAIGIAFYLINLLIKR